MICGKVRQKASKLSDSATLNEVEDAYESYSTVKFGLFTSNDREFVFLVGPFNKLHLLCKTNLYE